MEYITPMDRTLRDTILMDLWKAQLALTAFQEHMQRKYSLNPGDLVQEDGLIQRHIEFPGDLPVEDPVGN